MTKIYLFLFHLLLFVYASLFLWFNLDIYFSIRVHYTIKSKNVLVSQISGTYDYVAVNVNDIFITSYNDT